MTTDHKMTAKIVTIVTVTAVVVLAGAGILIYLDRDAHLLQPNNTRLVAQGAEIYTQYCALCHGANLGGQSNWQSREPDGKLPAPPHDESGHTWHHADQLLFDLTKFGLGALLGQDYETNMPVYDNILSDQEIVAVLSFIKSTWPIEVQDRHDLMNARSRNE
ncbi:MAG: cytochrome c [Fimbriimonadaceae bacterium]|nr:cytochrome c [Alphaproteobacteria bacterium]